MEENVSQFCSILESPIGKLSIFADDHAVHTITFSEKNIQEVAENEITKQAYQELFNYFDGKVTTFTFPITQKGTLFQQSVWEALCAIPYGDTLSYLKLSEKLKNPLAIRAIAAANGKNNIAIVVPCHRVIGSDGKLVGYAGELWRKHWLLAHEQAISGKGQQVLKF